MLFADLPTLGAGLGFRPPFRTALFQNQQAADFLEITADHYLEATSEKLDELDLLLDHFTLIPHGLNLSLGSGEGIDAAYLDKMAALVERVKSPWWSEHIAFTRAGGVEIGHLSPLPFTHEALAVLCRNIETVRRVIDTPLILENITFLVNMPGQEMNEAQFLAELLERSGCGLLLDITNLYINSFNHHYDPLEFLDTLPLERVVQMHFVGISHQDEWLIDSHAQPTNAEVWDLMSEAVARTPVKGIILERDDNIPPFAELAAEVAQARAIGQQHGKW